MQKLFRVLGACNMLLLVIFNSVGAVFRPKWYLALLFSTVSYVVATCLSSSIMNTKN
jgi:hypothetical protein